MPFYYLPAEWFPQSGIQLTWPHRGTDWSYMLEEIIDCYVSIAYEILKRQKLIVVCQDKKEVEASLNFDYNKDNLILAEIPSNDTWARDHSAISVFVDDKPCLYDFTFNGWGMKFPANCDNQINKRLFSKHIFSSDVKIINRKSFVLEGGAIESDGKGTLLTTTECLLSPNRNSYLNKQEIENYLKDIFGLKRILWLNYGYLEGDDTDSHIDTLARFCDEKTIVYVKCEDSEDAHYQELLKMEEELKSFVDFEGDPYRLIPLPMAPQVFYNKERLPATYANFLIMNEVVLLPVYNDKVKDELALKQLRIAFPDKEIIGINCLPIIKQHGSLHCITMQYPEGYIK